MTYLLIHFCLNSKWVPKWNASLSVEFNARVRELTSPTNPNLDASDSDLSVVCESGRYGHSGAAPDPQFTLRDVAGIGADPLLRDLDWIRHRSGRQPLEETSPNWDD